MTIGTLLKGLSETECYRKTYMTYAMSLSARRDEGKGDGEGKGKGSLQQLAEP